MCVLFSKYCEYVCAIRWLCISFYKCSFYCLSVYVILWIFMLSFDCLCYYPNVLLFFECLCYSLKLLLFSECFFYSLSFCVIIRLFVLFSECLCFLYVFILFSSWFCYSLNVSLIFWFFCLFCYSLFVLLLFECWLCLKSSSHHHSILFVDKSRADFQSRRPRHSLTETRRGLVMTSGILFFLSRIDSIPFSGTFDSEYEPCLEVTCRQAFLKTALEFSVKFIIPPSVHINLPLLPKRARRPDQSVHFFTLGLQLFYRFGHLKYNG
jgi:hypothetical protein